MNIDDSIARELLAELRAVHETLREMNRSNAGADERSRRPLSPRDQAAASTLLPAIYGVWKGWFWTVNQLLSTLHREEEASGARQDLRNELDAFDARSLARLLGACTDRAVGGFTVRRFKKEAAGRMWCVEVTRSDAE